jgi:tyrosyl-tRNA synthetase
VLHSWRLAMSEAAAAATAADAAADAVAAASLEDADVPAPAAAAATPLVFPELKRELAEGELPLRERFDLCRSVAEECVTDADLAALLAHKAHPVAYDGFEPSGRLHLAQC